MTECRCERPRPHRDPRRLGWCNACCRKLPSIPDEWIREFYAELRAALDTTGDGAAGKPLSVQALRRHDAGKETFGFRFLERSSNATEGTEEAADGSNYAAYDTFIGERLVALGIADESDVDAAKVEFIGAAYHFAKAHALLRAGRDKLRDAVED